jgi:cysteine desulfurase
MSDKKKYIYFDNNSTTRPFKEISRAGASAGFANASSYHRPGLQSRFAVETARAKAAAFIGAKPQEIIFCSCGTEANNLALAGVINYYKYAAGLGEISVIISAAEHHSVLNIIYNPAFKDINFIIAPVDKNGLVAPAELEKLITPSVILISVMMANNETGAIMPFEQIGALCRQKSILFHCDAVCASGKLEYDVKKINCDLLSVSAHKMYGPKGAACLYKKRGVEILPLIYGGHQENDLRAGTENIEAIEGFAACCEIIARDLRKINARYLEVKSSFINELNKNIPGVKINCSDIPTLANTVSAVFNFTSQHQANAFMFNLDTAGLAVSRGAACASGAAKPSHVLTAMGLNPLEANSTIRVSFGIDNSVDETIEAVKIIRAAYETVLNAGGAFKDE